MEIKQIIVTVRGTKGEVRKVTVDTAGAVLGGDESLLEAAKEALEAAAEGAERAQDAAEEPEEPEAPEAAAEAPEAAAERHTRMG